MSNLTQEFSPSSEILHQVSESIFFHIQEDLESFDVFASLPSSTIWQSPIELASSWIERVAPDSWSYFQDNTSDDPILRREKIRFKRHILQSTANLLYELASNPSTLQRISTRLLVQEALVQQLPITDQDRIIAAEIHAGYKAWQQILWVFGTYDELRIMLKMSWMLYVGIDDIGNPVCNFNALWAYILGDEIPGVIMESGNMRRTNEDGSIDRQSAPVLITSTLITHEVLQRFTDIIGMDKEKQHTREIVLSQLNGIPTWKKRGPRWGRREKKMNFWLKPFWQR